MPKWDPDPFIFSFLGGTYVVVQVSVPLLSFEVSVQLLTTSFEVSVPLVEFSLTLIKMRGSYDALSKHDDITSYFTPLRAYTGYWIS